MTRVLLLAQGTGDRWTFRDKPFLGRPKHLTVIDNETLLERARRLFKENGCEVLVIGPDDPRYGERITLEKPFPTGTEQDKFIGTKKLWSKFGRTIIAWADCYYTEEAIKTICTHPDGTLHYFRRPGANSVTGHRWDESFAVSFDPAWHGKVIEVAERVVGAVRAGYPTKDHIRTHYAAFLGVDLDKTSLLHHTPYQTHIIDWTDDFDKPEEWLGWVGRYYKNKVNAVIVIPWRLGNTWREKSREYVHRYYESENIPIHYGTCDTRLFNISACRNAAAREALEKHPEAEVIFFADNDTIVPSIQLWASLYLARTEDELVLAFDKYHKVSKDLTQALFNGRSPTLKGNRIITHHASGAVALPVGLWKEVGGCDERFVSWGAEDRALWLSCNACRWNLDSLRTPGNAYHLYHAPSPEVNPRLPEYQSNVALGRRYKAAAGVEAKTGCLPEIDIAELDPEEIKRILSEPSGPLNNPYPLGRTVTIEEIRAQVKAQQINTSILYDDKPETQQLVTYYKESRDRRMTVPVGSKQHMLLMNKLGWEQIENPKEYAQCQA